jgi:hypothetical protein
MSLAGRFHQIIGRVQRKGVSVLWKLAFFFFLLGHSHSLSQRQDFTVSFSSLVTVCLALSSTWHLDTFEWAYVRFIAWWGSRSLNWNFCLLDWIGSNFIWKIDNDFLFWCGLLCICIEE